MIPLLTLKEAASLLKIDLKTLRKARRSGVVPEVRISEGVIRIPLRGIERLAGMEWHVLTGGAAKTEDQPAGKP
jgi:predicted site-specific integrase-resolvase